MPLDTIFSFANSLALAGWLVLLASPMLPARALLVPRLLVPALLSLAYVVLILTGFSGAGGDFSSLDGVAALFADRSVLLASWLHFLAFDLLVGCFLVEDRRRRGLAFWLVLPCLVLTFLLGPAGYLSYLVLSWTLAPRAAAPGEPDTST